jgi:hypothetical protein
MSGCAIWLAISGTSLHAGQQSLKEIARANGGKASARLQVNTPFGSLRTVTEDASAVVFGRITALQPRLSKDEDFVATYVSLAPLQIWKGQLMQQPTKRPEFTSGIVFAMGGGKVISDGLEVDFIDERAPDPPLRLREDVIVFLKSNPDESGVFYLSYADFGLLRVRGDTVAESNRRVNRKLDSYKLADVERTIRNLVAAAAGRVK